MHASDRYLAPGATLDDLRDGRRRAGYADELTHGETGKGSTTTTRSSASSREVGFTGWISVEDGMNGLDELRGSVDFLKRKREEHF